MKKKKKKDLNIYKKFGKLKRIKTKSAEIKVFSESPEKDLLRDDDMSIGGESQNMMELEKDIVE